MIRSYKIRLYPTKEQEELMWKHIGSSRYVWNYMLAKQQEVREQGGKHLSAFDMIRALTPLKNDGEHDWLYDVSNKTLQITCQDLQRAYEKFFKKQAGFPSFKSRKRSKLSFPANGMIYFQNGLVVIERLKKVKYKTDFKLPQGKGHKFSNPRISYVNGKWMLAFGMEREKQAVKLTDKAMGVDLGVKDLVSAAYGDEQIVFHNINKSKRMRRFNKQLLHIQRSISRKYEANRQGKKYVKTNNIIREEEKLRKLCRRMANIRHNYVHQVTHGLVLKQPYRVVMEDLNVTGMIRNRHLARAIAEQNFAEFIRQMQYKCEDRGIEFVQADRFYPSSKTCSCCGCVKQDLKLRDRTYICNECGAVIDRDYNAALNLMRYAA